MQRGVFIPQSGSNVGGTEHLPGAEVIHLSNAPIDLSAMVSSIRFPVFTRRAPNRSTISLTHKNVLAIEVFQARCRFCTQRCMKPPIRVCSAHEPAFGPVALKRVALGFLRLRIIASSPFRFMSPSPNSRSVCSLCL